MIIMENEEYLKSVRYNNRVYFLIPFIQVIFYILFYELTNFFAHKMGWVDSRGVTWGISAQMYLYIYVAVVFISCVLGYFIRKLMLIAIVSSIVFSSFVAPVLNNYPYRGSVVILIGVAGIFINLLYTSYRHEVPSNKTF